MKKLLALAGIVLGLPVAANAQNYVPFPGFYVYGGAGPSWALGKNAPVSTGTGFAAGGGVGYDFMGPRLSLEAGFGRIPSDASFPGTAANGAGRQIRITANAYYDILPQSVITPYIGAGIGVGFMDGTRSFSSTRLAFQGMVGVAYHVDSNWTVGIEGKYTGTTRPSFQFQGQTIRYDNHQVSVLFGIAYKFGSPGTAAPPPPDKPVSGTAYMVFFDFDRSNITPTAATTIKQAATDAKAGKKTSIGVTGHADRSGADAYNMALSLRRAGAVKDQLVREGIPATAIAVVGRGESQPLVQTADGVREPQNRRVEIVLQ